MAFDKFKSFLGKVGNSKIVNNVAKGVATNFKGVPVLNHLGKNGLKSTLDLTMNFLPLIVGSACAMGGVCGLETFLGIKLSQGIRDNLKKNKLLSSPIQDWYEFVGNKTVDEVEYNKYKDKKMEKVSDMNSVFAYWKSLYDK